MESTSRQARPWRLKRLRWMALVVTMMLFTSMGAQSSLSAQDATESPETPDVVIPGTGDESSDPAGEAMPEALPEETPTEEATEEPAATEPNDPDTSSSGNVIQVSPTDIGNPAVMAHGLAFLTGVQSVWQVREVEPDGESDAASAISNAAFVYQVEGTSIIRNDVTGKRALLNPGEVFFKAGGDPYTTSADSNDSMVWIFEVVDPDSVADDAFYESPLIDDYAEGVFDLQIIRYVLEPGETATLPGHTGPALVVSVDGDIDIEADGLGLLATAQGQLITVDEATVTNNSQDPATFMLAAFGSEVADSTASAETESTGDATPEAAAVDDTSTDDTTTDDTVTDETTTDDTTTDESTDDSEDAAGGTETTINITAQAELYVVVVADGVTVFDGPIPDGGQSGEIVGTNFEVYTSYGAATLFTNACGDEFYMGFEEGEAQYALTAEPC